MVRLIASDIDGTLLLNGSRQISDETLDYINKIIDFEVVFAAASGRQYPNLLRLFEKIKGDMVYICENGALIKYKEETLYKEPLDRQLGMELLKDIYAREHCEVLLSGEKTSYLMPKEDSYVDHMKNYVGNTVKIIKDFDEVEEDFLKISVYEKDGIGTSKDYFHEKWGDKVNDTVSGAAWMDFVAKGVDKGKAVEKIQEIFKTGKEDTMCFGDSYNDVEMFKRSLYSYAMTSANSEIRAKARYVTNTVETVLYDVYQVLNR